MTGAYGPVSFTPTSVGTYHWIASYSGDGPNTSAVAGLCGDTGENDAVIAKQPTISTSANQSVTVGSAISDSATLGNTATAPGGAPAGGSITFKAYGPGDATCTGTPAFTSSPVTVSGNGTYGPVSFTPPAVGTYHWIASYSGDSPNTLAVAGLCGDTGENDTVIAKQPTISTSANQSVTVGSAISDSATLGNTAPAPGGAPAGGSITFKAYGPSDATCTGTAAFTSAPVAVTGDGTYGPVSFTPTTIGTYHWIASYSGDGPNTLAVAGLCGDPGENDTVTAAQPRILTQALSGPVEIGSQISDSATLGNTANKPGGGLAGGTITFTAYGPDDATCTGTPAFTSSPIPVSGNGSYGPVSFTPTTVGTYRWIASYSGDSPNTLAVSGSCNDTGESSIVAKDVPTVTTTLHNASGGAVVPEGTALDLGTGMFDVAHVSSTDGLALPGTVTFEFFHNGSCFGPALGGEVESLVAVVGGNPGTATSSNHLDLPAGSYSFIAQYFAGTADLNHSDSALSGCEPFSIKLATPGLATTGLQEQRGAGPVTLGTATHDTATLSGKVDSFRSATGPRTRRTGRR